MFGLLNQLDNAEDINKYKEKNPTAKILGKTECQRCGACCYIKPCIIPPTRMKIVANFLKVSVNEMINKYMVINYRKNNKGEKVYFVIWANENQQHLVGKLLSSKDTWIKGQCIHYDSEKRECKIFEVLTEESIGNKCWEDDQELDIFSGWKVGDIDQFDLEFFKEDDD